MHLTDVNRGRTCGGFGRWLSPGLFVLGRRCRCGRNHKERSESITYTPCWTDGLLARLPDLVTHRECLPRLPTQNKAAGCRSGYDLPGLLLRE